MASPHLMHGNKRDKSIIICGEQSQTVAKVLYLDVFAYFLITYFASLVSTTDIIYILE